MRFVGPQLLEVNAGAMLAGLHGLRLASPVLDSLGSFKSSRKEHKDFTSRMKKPPSSGGLMGQGIAPVGIEPTTSRL